MVRSGSRRGSPVRGALSLRFAVALALGLLLGLSSALGAGIALPAPTALAATPGASRPTQPVAYARIALVRVLTYYFGTINGSAPIPALNPCAADAVLIGTTGDGLNSGNYVLLPTVAVDPLTPCQGAQAAFQQLNGNATGWSLSRVEFRLNAAYTGIGDQQRGAISYTINPAQITTNGGASGPPLLALRLDPLHNAPAHDLPVLSLPQPSDAPADPNASAFLDLTGPSGALLARDSLTADEATTTLYPVDVSVGLPPTSSATTTPAATATQATSAPIALSQLSLGAPEIDGNGRLVGMVIPDGHGGHTLASSAMLKDTIKAVTGKSGPLMTAWTRGLSAFYAMPPQFSEAASAFGGLASSAPDFAGATPFLTAAQRQTTAIPALTQPAAVATATPAPALSGVPGAPARNPRLLLFAALVVIVVLLVAALLALVIVRARAQRPAPRAAPVDDPRLDLLPPDLPLDQLPSEQPTQPLAVAGPTAAHAQPSHGSQTDLEGTPTLVLAATIRPTAPAPRLGTSLMPHAAGLTDPGIKRAAEPNQDSILALNGLRVAAGRTQPYGLFIVADGMGGHLHGQEASRLAIELVARAMLPSLTGTQPLDDTALATLLRTSVQQAHGELSRRNRTERVDMGTTLTGALIVDDRAHIVNVGDSRTYLMNPDAGLRQVTTDHSVVASLVTAGVIRPEEVYTHPRRNQIYRSLGGEEEEVELDAFDVTLQAGDKLLFCSDGLWEMVRDPQIANILRATADPQQAAYLLVREANTNGGEDNISAIVVRMLEDVPRQAQPGMNVLAAPQSAELPPVH